jgi:hypothetical protein
LIVATSGAGYFLAAFFFAVFLAAFFFVAMVSHLLLEIVTRRSSLQHVVEYKLASMRAKSVFHLARRAMRTTSAQSRAIRDFITSLRVDVHCIVGRRHAAVIPSAFITRDFVRIGEVGGENSSRGR